MVAKKSATKKESKLKVGKETVRDLDVQGKAAAVKGGQRKREACSVSI